MFIKSDLLIVSSLSFSIIPCPPDLGGEALLLAWLESVCLSLESVHCCFLCVEATD